MDDMYHHPDHALDERAVLCLRRCGGRAQGLSGDARDARPDKWLDRLGFREHKMPRDKSVK